MKKIVRYILLIVMATLLVCGIVWAHGKASAELCTGIDVVISNADSSSLVTEQGIKDKMNRLGLKAVGNPVGKVDIHAIESKLRELEYEERHEKREDELKGKVDRRKAELEDARGHRKLNARKRDDQLQKDKEAWEAKLDRAVEQYEQEKKEGLKD